MIKKELLMALSVSVLLLGGCVDSSTGAAARADMEGSDGHKAEAKVEKKAEAPKAEKKAETAVKKEAKAEVAKKEEPKVQENAPAEEKKAPATAEVNTATCAGCHGANFENHAMGKSKIVKDMTKADIITALKGYKDGSYGGAMKGVMKGQADPLNDAQIEAIANKIGK